MNKVKIVLKTLISVISPIFILLFIILGEVKIAKGQEIPVILLLIILPIMGMISGIKKWQKEEYLVKTVNASEEEYRMLKKLKNKNKDTSLSKTIFKVVMILVGFVIMSILSFKVLIPSNLPFLLTLVISIANPIVTGLGIAFVIIKFSNENLWYYNLDEYLLSKYRLQECLNKKENLIVLKDKVNELKNKLKEKKKNGELDKALLQPEELMIQGIRKEIEILKNTNGYKKILLNGNEIWFEYKIVSKSNGKNCNLYNIQAILTADENAFKTKEEQIKIIENNRQLNIDYSVDGYLKLEFAQAYDEINYEILAIGVSCLYEASIEFLNA